jgi:uncharacterized protein
LDHPDYEQVSQYVTALLERNLPPQRVYHNLAHTRDEVLAAVERLAAMEGIEGEDLLLLRTAAWFHDAGFIVQGANHESIGAELASRALPDFGYQPEQIATIQGMILATRLPQSPRTLLEQLMADADLDLLGCDEFIPRNHDLRVEMAAYGQTMTDHEWLSSQLDFLCSHVYFTASATALRSEGKLRNAQLLQQALAELAVSDA